MFHWLTERRRKHLLDVPFPEPWIAILAANVAAYPLLSAAEQKHLRDLVQVFLAEKNFEGAGGLELTDEIRVTIAGTGCQLLLGRDHDLFRRLVSIVVYPSTVVLPPRPLGVFTMQPHDALRATPIAGLATHVGTVVLAWDHALTGARDARDGRNTVIHEFAHQIDMADGRADGTPPMTPPEATHWGRVFEAAFLAQKARSDTGQPSLLRDYAITNEAEYFAVATEVFFEQPRALLDELPDVYAELRRFYGLDLAARALAPK
jgi:MtfA peptidase